MTQNLTLLLKAQDMATKTLQSVSGQIDKLNKKTLNLAKKGFKQMGDTWQGVAQQLKTGMVVGLIGLVGAFGIATKTATDFQTAMNNLEAVSGATSSQIKELRNQAKQMGIQTKFSATQAAEGQTFLAMAGFKVEEIMSALPEVLNLAAAGNLDLARSADIVSNIMGQFGIKAKDTARVTNVLAATASSSNTNIEQLSEAMKYLGPTAKSLGMSIESTSAMIGILGDSGIQGSLAGRALGSSLVRLAKPTKQMSNAMEAMNVKAFDMKGNFIGMPKLLEQLEKGTKSMTQEQKASNLYAMVGAEAFQEISILLERGSKNYLKYQKSITQTNKAQTMALIQQKGLPGAMTALNSALQGQMIALFDLEVAGKSLIDWMGEATFKVVELIRSVDFEKIKTNIIKFADIAKQKLQPVIDFLGGGTEVLKTILAGLAGIITAIVVPALAILIAQAVLVASPFILIGLAVAGLYQLWINNFGGIQEITMKVFSVLSEYFKNIILPMIDELKVSIQNELLPAFINLWNFLSPVLIPLLAVGLTNAIIFIITQFTFLINVIKILITWFSSMSGVIIKYVKGAIDLVIGVLTGDWNRAWNGAKAMVSAVTDGIRANIKLVLDSVNAVIKRFSDMKGLASGVSSKFNFKIPGFAVGTSHHKGGPMLVGENGPEIVNAPAGTTVDTANTTERKLNNGGNKPNIIYSPVINFSMLSKPSLSDQKMMSDNQEEMFLQFLKKYKLV